MVKDLASKRGRSLYVVARSEGATAIKNIDESMKYYVADGIMIARGDLGAQIPIDDGPRVRRKIIRKSNLMRRLAVPRGRACIGFESSMDPMNHESKETRSICKRKIFDFFGVKTARLKRRMENSGVTLRLRGLRDVPILRPLFETEKLLQASGIKPKTFRSLLCFWKWEITTFKVTYVIEVAEKNGRNIIGFIGLYKMSIGQSLWLSLAIFNPKDRRQGYGRQALELLLDFFQKNAVVRTAYVEIQKANAPSLCFFRKFGFSVYGQYEDKLFLEKSLIEE